MKRLRSSTVLFLSALLLICLGCNSRQPPGSLGPILRFIDEPPQAPLSRQDFTTAELVFDWKLRDLRLIAHWQQDGDAKQFDVTDRAATVTWERDLLIFERDFGLPASAIDRIEVVLKSRSPSSYTGNVELLWASADEDFGPERRMVIEGGDLVGDRRLFAFRTLDSAGWQGTIERIQVICRLAPKARAQLLRLTAYDETIDEENLKELAATAAQATLGGQLRNALQGLPKVPHERQLDIPADAELRFAYGLEPGTTAPVRFVVTAEPAKKEAVGTGQAHSPTELFAATVKPSTDPGWRTARVDLRPFADQNVMLRLEVYSDEPLDLGKGLPLWGHPEVLAPR